LLQGLRVLEEQPVDSKTLLKIYGVVGAALFSFAFNLFWLERTGASILKQIVPHAKTPSAVLIGTFAISIVSLFLLLIVERHWRLLANQPWYKRLPGAFVDPPDPRDSLAKAIKLFAFVLFILVPAYISAHFLHELWSVPIVDRRDVFHGLTFHSPTLTFTSAGTLSNDNRFRIAERDGVSFFPTLEPLLIGVLVAAQCSWTVVQTGRILRSILFK
jgi:hypothetical protein